MQQNYSRRNNKELLDKLSAGPHFHLENPRHGCFVPIAGGWFGTCWFFPSWYISPIVINTNHHWPLHIYHHLVGALEHGIFPATVGMFHVIPTDFHSNLFQRATKLENITSTTMVYGTYNELVTGVYVQQQTFHVTGHGPGRSSENHPILPGSLSRCHPRWPASSTTLNRCPGCPGWSSEKTGPCSW